MDFLNAFRNSAPPAVAKSPFWSRMYGGYTEDQIDFTNIQLGQKAGLRILDPMCGQAYSLSQLSWFGAKVFLADINPGPLALAMLRDPLLIKAAEELADSLESDFAAVKRHRRRRPAADYSSQWLSPDTKRELRVISDGVGINLSRSPFKAASDFWTCDAKSRLYVGVMALAARSLVCYRATDNRTWLREGGVTPELSVHESAIQALGAWQKYAAAILPMLRGRGTLTAATCRSDDGTPPGIPLVDYVVVSPPYANRLDYSSLWAPETAILSALFEVSGEHLKWEQLGSTVVRNRKPSEEAVKALPPLIQKALDEIRNDTLYASEHYYYPFFANYAVGLARAVAAWARALKPGGRLIVFVRDTVRKDKLFPTDQLITAIGERHGLVVVNGESHRKIIKHHVGLLRQKRGSAGLRGLAQQELWQVFEKE